jgi:hypothetical protein
VYVVTLLLYDKHQEDSLTSNLVTCLQLASVHAADSILSQLLEWREYALKVVMDTSRPNHAVLMRSRVRL